jgi:nudix-type nucleoside diphosphatase (YffH/AdpP family)
MNGRIEDIATLHQGWLSLRMACVRMDDGSLAEREIVDHPCGAAVLLYDPDRRTALLITELRPPVEFAGEPRMLEVVAGKLDEADAAACARREAKEEAGVEIGALDHVARLWPTPASSTERVDYFLAAYSRGDRVSEGGGLEEEQEEVRVREVPLATLWGMAQAGEIRDAKTFLLLQALRLRRPDLFG